jgi:FkbM family methyltransferase
VERGMAGATGNIYCGLHEFEDMSFLLHFLRPEDLFVDIGANIGSYTILASGQVGCKTISFEPIPATYYQLKNNIMVNHLEDLVQARNLGVGAKEETLVFTSKLDTVNHVAISGEPGETIRVSINSLDHYLDQLNPTLLKIDVEGFEKEVIHGASGTLKNPALKAIIIELNGSGLRYGYKDDHIHQQLLEHHFLPYRYLPFSRELVRINSFGTHNTLYLRDVSDIQLRIKEASLITVLKSTF